MDAVVYGDAVEGVSKNRATDGGADPQMVDHDTLEAAAGPTSPGLRATGLGW